MRHNRIKVLAILYLCLAGCSVAQDRSPPGPSLGHYVVWAILLGGPLIAILSLLTASRRNCLSTAEFAMLVLPVVAFVAIASNRGAQEVHVGVFVWSIQIALGCMYALGFKVFVLDHFSPIPAKPTSKVFLLLLVFAASAFAALAPIKLFLGPLFRT
jgi:hypothetical protein